MELESNEGDEPPSGWLEGVILDEDIFIENNDSSLILMYHTGDLVEGNGFYTNEFPEVGKLDYVESGDEPTYQSTELGDSNYTGEKIDENMHLYNIGIANNPLLKAQSKQALMREVMLGNAAASVALRQIKVLDP